MVSISAPALQKEPITILDSNKSHHPILVLTDKN
jgi:hypothetical protein